MRFETTKELMTIYGDKLIAGTITPDEIRELDLVIQDFRETKSIAPMDSMLDLVIATAPEMTFEILHELVQKLIHIELTKESDKNLFLRTSTLGKYYLAYQACFDEKRANEFLEGAELKEILGNPSTLILSKLVNCMVGSAQISLLFHMVKDKANLSSEKKFQDKIASLEKESINAYRELSISPTNTKSLKKLQNALLKLNQTLSENFRAITEESSADYVPPSKPRKWPSILSLFSSRPTSAAASASSHSQQSSRPSSAMSSLLVSSNESRSAQSSRPFFSHTSPSSPTQPAKTPDKIKPIAKFTTTAV